MPAVLTGSSQAAGTAAQDQRFAVMASLDDKITAIEAALDALHTHPTPDIANADQAEFLMNLRFERDLCESRRKAIATGAAFTNPGTDAAAALIKAIQNLDAITAFNGALVGLGGAIVALLAAFPGSSTLA